jgi:hypothetical protein
MNLMRRVAILTRAFLVGGAAALSTSVAKAQSADWQSVIWREPQVRYLLADMTGGGATALYRDYASKERDPDSTEAIRLWDAGVRVVNIADFERRWVTNRFGKDGRVFRVVFRGTERTITGNEVVLSNDGLYQQAAMRTALLDLTLGAPAETYRRRAGRDAAAAEALHRFGQGCRVVNPRLFERRTWGKSPHFVFKGSGNPVEPALIRLNSDLPYPEVNARYFLADIHLGGSRDFYQRAAESAHEMGCQEAVTRFDAGVKIVNLDAFERKQVDGRTVITRKGSNERISGNDVRLSSDPP